jgi:hypothetical protein
VHRPGYHVQWKKIERTENSNQLESKIKETNRSNNTDEITLESTEVEQVNNRHVARVLINEVPKTHESKASDSPLASSIESTLSEPHSTSFKEEAKSNEQSIAQYSIPPIFWRTPPQNLRKLGIALMLIGGMILFASLLVYFGAFSGSGNGAWLDFFLYLIDISGWFWLLFFIVVFILVSYLFFLFVLYVLGGPVVGLFVGLGLLALGIFFYILGDRRVPEPPN